MKRFLIAFVHNLHETLELSREIFEISADCSPYDVTVPTNTLLFMIVTANVQSAKELTESFVTFKLDQDLLMYCSVGLNPEENGKRYWIGKLAQVRGSHGVYNEHLHSFISISCLAENDEIIDL